MDNNIDHENYRELIRTLNRLGYNIVFIDDEYYIIREFIPASDLVKKHRLVGSNIKNLYKNNFHLLNTPNSNSDTKITQATDALPKETREYSHYFEWKTFLSL